MSTHICIFVPHVRNKHMAFCLAHHNISLNIDVHSSTQSQTTIHRSIELPKEFSGIEKYQPTTQYTLPLDAKYESTNDNDGRAFCGVQCGSRIPGIYFAVHLRNRNRDRRLGSSGRSSRYLPAADFLCSRGSGRYGAVVLMIAAKSGIHFPADA